MNKHRVLIVVLALAAVAGSVLMVWPAVQPLVDRDTDASIAPEFGSTITVANQQVVLPETTEEPARIYFDLTNTGDRTVHLTEVHLSHASDTAMQQTEGPAWKPVANLPIDPGETLSLAPGGTFAVVTNYDSFVVPGATVNVTLVFDTSTRVTVPATVSKAI